MENVSEHVEQQLNIINKAVIEAARETIGEEKRTRNKWYDGECRGHKRKKRG
jgi:hypothetical protein